MNKDLKPGYSHTFTVNVDDELTVPSLLPRSPIFSGMPRVLATGYFVGLVEWACMEALEPYLQPGEGSVGTMVNITHTSPTPLGMEVTIEVRCVDVEGRKTVWEFTARDEKDPIGKGRHERFTVNWEKFEKSLEEKKGK